MPQTTDMDRAEVALTAGVEDKASVVAEKVSQWVIEDDFAGARPAWDLSGALLVEDVDPYEQVKLRLLNGSHSAIAYLGALAGFESVSDAMRSTGFGEYVRALMDLDVTPTLRAPEALGLDEYKDALVARFADPALRHRVLQICQDGSQKLPYRLLATIRDCLSIGREPRFACLAVAAWMRYVTAGVSDDGAVLELDDPLADRLHLSVRRDAKADEVVGALLGITEVFPDELASDRRLRDLLSELLGALMKHGAAAVVSSFRAHEAG